METSLGKMFLGLLGLAVCFSNIEITLGYADIKTGPEDVFQKPGQDVQFHCELELQPGSKPDAMEWKRNTVEKGSDESIYNTYDPPTVDESKYTVEQITGLNSNIVVKSVNWADAGAYTCESMTKSTLSSATADLMVVDKPKILIPEDIKIGERGIITCEVDFLGNYENNNMLPQLEATIGSTSLRPDGDQRLNKEVTPYRLEQDFPTTMTEAWHGENLTCTARGLVEFESCTTIALEIPHPTTEAKATLEKEIYHPGDSINCTANGFPVPLLRWYREHHQDDYDNMGRILIIRDEMIGDNTWICEATYDGNAILSDPVSFKVEQADDPSTGKSTSDETTVIIIAVVVPVIVILIILIVVCIVCNKKKSSSTTRKPKKDKNIEEGAEPRADIYNPPGSKRSRGNAKAVPEVRQPGAQIPPQRQEGGKTYTGVPKSEPTVSMKELEKRQKEHQQAKPSPGPRQTPAANT